MIIADFQGFYKHHRSTKKPLIVLSGFVLLR